MKNQVKTLAELINNASSKKRGFEFVRLFEISLNVAEKIFLKSGIDLTGFTVVIESDAIRHVLNEHGNQKKEAVRGQVAITEDHLSLIPSILKSADIIERAGTNSKGLEVIRFVKQIDGDYYVLEEVRNGRKQLALCTMFIKKPPVLKTEG